MMHSTSFRIWDALSAFSFYYPLFMSYLWMAGALFYYFHYERKPSRNVDSPPKSPEYPKVSIVVPCFNEQDQVEEVISTLMLTRYPNFDVIAVNDGSADGTGAMLDQLSRRYTKLRVIHLVKNQGKAIALNTAALLSDSEFLVCIDGDALLDPNAVSWIMSHLVNSPRVGAVTGNPRVRTRSTLLGRVQMGEFSSIIGLIKRAQRTYGRIFTLSGVVAGFRKSALHEVGFWSSDMLTEDVDVSWKLQSRHWDIRFEPRALCWILMPETLGGLWKQRLRWSMGGTQVLFSNTRLLRSWRQRRLWPVYLEYFSSVAWAYAMASLILLWLLGTVFKLPVPYQVATLLPQWTGLIIGTTCLMQIAISMFLDGRYDKGMGRHYYWMIWYPLAYWLISVATSVVALPKVILRGKGKRARWTSPDRGLRPT